MEEIVRVACLIREIAEFDRRYDEASRLWGSNQTEINELMRIIVNDVIKKRPDLLDSFNDAINTDEMMFYSEVFNTDVEMEIESASGDEELIYTDSDGNEDIFIANTAEYFTGNSENKLKKIISEISNAFKISNDLVLDILLSNNFMTDVLIEDSSDKNYLKKEFFNQERLTRCLFNETRECEKCSTNHQSHEMFELSCGHKFCFDCWKSNMMTKIESGNIEIVCLHKDCSKTVSVESIRKFVSAEIFDHFMQIAEHRFAQSYSNRMIKCSNVECRKVLTIGIDDQYGNAIECKNCGHFTCIKCKERAHFPLKCHDIHDYEKNIKPKIDSQIEFRNSQIVEREEAILVFLIMITHTFSLNFLNVMRYRLSISTLIKFAFSANINVQEVRESICEELFGMKHCISHMINDNIHLSYCFANKVMELRQLICLYQSKDDKFEDSLKTFLENDRLVVVDFEQNENDELELGDEEYLFSFHDSFLKNEWINICNEPLPRRMVEKPKKCPLCQGFNFLSNNHGFEVLCNCGYKFCWNCMRSWYVYQHLSSTECQFTPKGQIAVNEKKNPHVKYNERLIEFAYFVDVYEYNNPPTSTHHISLPIYEIKNDIIDMYNHTKRNINSALDLKLFIEQKKLYVFNTWSKQEKLTFQAYNSFYEIILNHRNHGFLFYPDNMKKYILESSTKIIESIGYGDSQFWITKLINVFDNLFYLYYCLELNNMLLKIADKQILNTDYELSLINTFINHLTQTTITGSIVEAVERIEERIKLSHKIVNTF